MSWCRHWPLLSCDRVPEYAACFLERNNRFRFSSTNWLVEIFYYLSGMLLAVLNDRHDGDVDEESYNGC
jgi:hypothetical protein